MLASHHTRRRGAALVAAALSAALLLTGCAASTKNAADTGSTAQNGTTASSLLPKAEGATKYPLTLTTPWGETVLKKRPERIAVLTDSASEAEMLAAIGVTPVWAPATIERAVWTLDALPAKVETISKSPSAADVPYEEIAAANPDLIIQTAGQISDRYGKLAAIAPVLSVKTEAALENSDWRDKLKLIGTTLDLADAANKATEKYDNFFTKLRADHPEFKGLTAAYVVEYGGKYGISYFSAAGSDVESFFLSLGFAPNPLAKQFTNDPKVSPELISQIDADVLLIADNTDTKEISTLLTGTKLFQQLRAAKSGQYAVIKNLGSGYAFEGKEYKGNLAWALAGPGPLAAPWAAKQIVPILDKALSRNGQKPVHK